MTSSDFLYHTKGALWGATFPVIAKKTMEWMQWPMAQDEDLRHFDFIPYPWRLVQLPRPRCRAACQSGW